MKAIQTQSIMIQNLCVPCFNRCRYCLLSWDGKPVGTDWERGVVLAERYISELRAARPGVNVSYAFGYSMEHPELRKAIEGQCRELMQMLKAEGIKNLNFTVYGLKDYHDRFAGRIGDYDLLLRMMNAADQAGISFDSGIPITKENVRQTDELVGLLKHAGSRSVTLFIPHEEGRGKTLNPIRLEQDDLTALSPESSGLLNRTIYRTESEWLSCADPVQETKRMILLSFRSDNVNRYETRSAISVVEEIEALDEAYHSAFPDFAELAKEYGDAAGKRLYRIRDLHHHYRALFAADHNLELYDVTDERQSGSRRS